jgi:hypothetical protein
MKYVKSKFTLWQDETFDTIVKGFTVETDWCTLEPDGTLLIRAGYPWDGATGAFDTRDIIEASLVHDVFCEMINDDLLPSWIQALADEEFRMIGQSKKMPWIRRMWTYFAVRFYQINKRRRAVVKVYTV